MALDPSKSKLDTADRRKLPPDFEESCRGVAPGPSHRI